MMASSHSPPHSHHQHSKEKKQPRLALAFGFLFSAFLLAVVLFSKRSLEPSAAVYTDLSLPSPSRRPRDQSDPPSDTPRGSRRESAQLPKSGILDDGSASNGQRESTQVTKSVILENGSSSEAPPSLESDDGGVGFASNGERELPERNNGAMGKCDLYRGSWVRDEERYPLYRPGSCPFVDDAYTCQENGRPDGEYVKWRWKPDGCNLPRFNGTDFLERLRGRRMMLVGDSMNRNQFESLLCLLHEALPDKSKMYERNGYKITKGRGRFIFQFSDYNCTVEFSRSHFLVREGVRLNQQGKTRPTLSIDRIDKTSSRWKHADILIFNTGHWWTHGKTSRGKDYYQEGDAIYPKFDPVEAYKKAMKTWGTWIDKNMNPRKHVVFYRGYSTAHFRGGEWDSGGTCNGETEPISKGPILDNYPLKMGIMEEVIHEMKFPVILLNVTRLTNFRKDGHPSIYGKKRVVGERVSSRKQDCSHWCLPGVPDTWNELIYANLILEQIQAQREG